MLLEVGVIAGKEGRYSRMLRRKNKIARHSKTVHGPVLLGAQKSQVKSQTKFLKRATKLNENNQNKNLKEK